MCVCVYIYIYIFLVFWRVFFFFAFPFHSQFVCPQMTLIWTRITGSGSTESPLIKPGAPAGLQVALRKQSYGGSLQAGRGPLERGGGREGYALKKKKNSFFFLRGEDEAGAKCYPPSPCRTSQGGKNPASAVLVRLASPPFFKKKTKKT